MSKPCRDGRSRHGRFWQWGVSSVSSDCFVAHNAPLQSDGGRHRSGVIASGAKPVPTFVGTRSRLILHKEDETDDPYLAEERLLRRPSEKDGLLAMTTEPCKRNSTPCQTDGGQTCNDRLMQRCSASSRGALFSDEVISSHAFFVAPRIVDFADSLEYNNYSYVFNALQRFSTQGHSRACSLKARFTTSECRT